MICYFFNPNGNFTAGFESTKPIGASSLSALEQSGLVLDDSNEQLNAALVKRGTRGDGESARLDTWYEV